MSSLVIVAIPREDDLVWKISSEKVPHLTLMYLGETEDANHAGRMAQFVQHALNINEHGPFYLTVDRRGELGEDKADVLFFEGGWDSKWIKSLRGQLLKQNDIRTAFEAQDQFPDWVPHLTLGYPDAPAKELPDDFTGRIYSVEFDRIAVWIGDYEGPEFRLKWPEREMSDDCAIAYSDIDEASVEDLLHYGVKGMQWGKRKEPSVIEKPKQNLTGKQQAAMVGVIGGGALLTSPLPIIGAFAGLAAVRQNKAIREGMDKNDAERKAYTKDKKWEKEFKKDKKYTDVHNDMADHMNSWLPGHNKKYDGIDLNKNPTKMKEYEDGYFKEQTDSFARSYSKIYGSSPSGKYKVSVIPGTNKVVLHNTKADPSAFKHAADDEPLMTFAVTHEKTGRIIKVEPVEDSMAQTANRGAEFLEHYGVKGMKWGQRKEDRPAETRGPGVEGMFDPTGHDKGTDIAKSILWPLVPPLGVFAIPAQVRLTRGAARGTKAYLQHRKTPEEVAKREKRRLSRRDFYWEQHTYSDISHADVHNKVADEVDHKVFQLASAPKYRGKNLKADKKLKDEYDQDVAKVTDAAYRRAVNDVYGTNPSGTKKAHYVDDARGQRIEVRDNTGKHLYENALTSAHRDVEEHDTLGDTVHHAADDGFDALPDGPFDGPDLFVTVREDGNGFIISMGRVKITEDDDDSLAQGEEFVDAVMHFGVKGMQWGKRKAQVTGAAKSAGSATAKGAKAAGSTVAKGARAAAASPAAQATAKKASAARDTVGDARFKVRAKTNPVIVHTMTEAINRTRNEDLPKINEKYKGKAKTSTRLKVGGNPFNNDATQKAYHKEVSEAYVKQLGKVADSQTSGSGRLKYELRPGVFAKHPSAVRWRVKAVKVDKVEHAVFATDEFDLVPKFDADGFIVDFDIHPVDAVAHSMLEGEEFILEHFGIKGMRWGRRSNRPAPEAVAPKATSRVPHGEKRKTKIDTEGGENHPAHEDAIKVAAAQAKLKKSGTSALSNKELQDVANRIQLEERVSLLTASAGRKFVRKHLTNQSDALARAGLQEAVKTGPATAKKVRRGATTMGRIAAMPV